MGSASAPAGPRQPTRGGSTPTVGTPGRLPILTLFADDIRLNPFPVAVGKEISVSVNLFNRGRALAQGARVEVFIDNQRLGAATLDVPAGVLRIASGFTPWQATVGVHTAKAVVTLGTKQQEVSKPFEVRMDTPAASPRLPILPPGRPPISAPSQPILVLSSLGIHTTPAVPRPGQPVEITVDVRNQGGAEARGVRVEAFVDTTRLGETTTNIGTHQTVLVRGFPQWTAAPGVHTLHIVATLGTQKREASKTLTVGEVLVTSPVIRPPILTAQPPSATFNLAITSNDIRLTPPAPKPGERVQIEVDVRNQGQDAAPNVRVEVFVDVPRLGEQTLSPIATKGLQTARFQWTATVGMHIIRAVASVGTYRTPDARRYVQVVAPPPSIGLGTGGVGRPGVPATSEGTSSVSRPPTTTRRLRDWA